MFVMGDLLMFTIFFSLYLQAKNKSPLLFDESQAALNPTFGVINTIVLLTSSLFVVLAVQSAHRGLRERMLRFVIMTMACGALFSMLKSIEYRDKFSHGISIVTNEFFMYYFVITGLHMVHLVVGMLILFFFFITNKSSAVIHKDSIRSIESVATFWHLVDLLWIVIFPLLYLAK